MLGIKQLDSDIFWPPLCISTDFSSRGKRRKETSEADGELPDDPNVTENDLYMADVIRTPYEEDLSDPKPPPGFVKVSNHSIGIVRKATVIYAFFNTRELVSSDRLRRFITKKKNATSRETHIYTSDFIIMNVDRAEEYCQVVAFRKMAGRSRNIAALEWSLYDDKNRPVKDVGVLVNLFKLNDVTYKLMFSRTLIDPICLNEFVRHVDPEEYLGMM